MKYLPKSKVHEIGALIGKIERSLSFFQRTNTLTLRLNQFENIASCERFVLPEVNLCHYCSFDLHKLTLSLNQGERGTLQLPSLVVQERKKDEFIYSIRNSSRTLH